MGAAVLWAQHHEAIPRMTAVQTEVNKNNFHISVAKLFDRLVGTLTCLLSFT